MGVNTKAERREFYERHSALVDSHYIDHLNRRFDALEPRDDIVAQTELRMLRQFYELRTRGTVG